MMKIFIWIATITIISSCSIKDGKLVKDLVEGEKLASIHCISCHKYPSPLLLDKKTWMDQVLPVMAARMGIVENKKSQQSSLELQSVGLFPNKPMISYEDWAKIKLYYLYNAQTQLNVPKKSLEPKLKLFTKLNVSAKNEIPATSLIKLNEGEKTFYFGNANNNNIYLYDLEKGIIDSTNIGGSPSVIIPEGDSLYVLSMGNIHPNDRYSGFLKLIKSKKEYLILENLPRPVFAQLTDLNGDDLNDFIISGFGYNLGEFSWYKNKGDHFEKHILKNSPGAIISEVLDFNSDGNLDIVVLIAQGNEGIFLYEGDGKGNFKEKTLLSFPPSYGSTYFTFFDFNQDGLKDIFYINGDNADFESPIMKPYHGVRIYYQKKDHTFEEGFFYHINGAFKGIPEDFDLDGDIDIAVISYFPDYENSPEESFVYLENQGDYDFKAWTNDYSTEGKWLIMEKGDIDLDGDQDLILGSSILVTNSVPKQLSDQWKQKKQPVMVLINNTK
ncbi:MAG: VCBS repeat-containing protein [Cyclobacteriaceae bacterium]|nr:VCBS repeat-containing protein [Cyclobacteriaceae bacterium]